MGDGGRRVGCGGSGGPDVALEAGVGMEPLALVGPGVGMGGGAAKEKAGRLLSIS